MKIIVDAMGGDNAPQAIVQGALDAHRQHGVDILLVGRAAEVLRAVEACGEKTLPAGVELRDASEVVEISDDPATAFKMKKDSSLTVGLNLLKAGEGDAFVSAGSTGALLSGATLLVKRIRGIRRAAMGPVIPVLGGKAVLCDCGANAECTPEYLMQFAYLGNYYAKRVLGVEKPRVALLNIGAEEEKGNALVKETMPLLKACTDINFIGSIEAREIPYGGADVIVCEAFVGNVILKLYEGTASALMKMIKDAMMSTTRGKIGGALAMPALKGLKKTFDASEYGGAPMLGLNGLVVKAHGNSTAAEIRNAIFQCASFKEQEITDKIKKMLETESERKKENE